MDEWLTIVSYRDFHDMPRLILAADNAGKHWVLDSKFDNDTDDYLLDYAIHFAGREVQEAQSVFERCAAAAGISDEEAASVPVRSVEFDPARRHRLLIRSRGEGGGSSA